MKKLFILSIMAWLAVNNIWGQSATSKATLKKLHPSLSVGGGRYSSREGYCFKWEENEAYIIELSGISLYMNKIQVGDEKAAKKIKIETPVYGEKKVKLQSAFNIGKDVYITAISEDKKTDKVTYLAYKADLKNFTVSSTPLVLDTYIDVKGQSISYGYEVIEEKSLLIKKNFVVKKEDISKITYMMFDNNIKKLWEREIEPAMTGKNFFVEEYHFLDEDNLLVTCVEYPDGRRRAKKKGKPNYKYHLFYYTNKMQTVKDYELDLEGKFITDISAGINKNKQIICAGFYSKEGFYNLTGSFYMKINTETKAVEKTSIKEFDDSFNLSLMNKGQKRRAKRKQQKGDDIDAPDFDMRDLYYDDNGNALLLAEDFYIVEHCTTNPKTGAVSCTYSYHYDDLIAVAINNTGEIAWTTKIDKKLTFGGSVSESFVTINEKGKWVFIYNENLKNLEKDAKEAEEGEEDDGTDRSAGRKNSAPVLVILDENGKYTKEVLMMPEGKKSIIVENGFHMEMPDHSHIISIKDAEGKYFYYRLDLKL